MKKNHVISNLKRKCIACESEKGHVLHTIEKPKFQAFSICKACGHKNTSK